MTNIFVPLIWLGSSQVRRLCFSSSDLSDENTHFPIQGWANEGRRSEEDSRHFRGPPEAKMKETRTASSQRPHAIIRESKCPIPGCVLRLWKMRYHCDVTEVHLHPIFRTKVPCVPDITREKMAVLDWLCLRHLGLETPHPTPSGGRRRDPPPPFFPLPVTSVSVVPLKDWIKF